MHSGQTAIAFLRGINVGGHHKVPMADLRDLMHSLGYVNVKTILNSGNVIYHIPPGMNALSDKSLAAHLENAFGFPIPVISRTASDILRIIDLRPFHDIEPSKDMRLYVSFLAKTPTQSLDLPWLSEDQSYSIIDIMDNTIFSVLDLSVIGTPKGMKALEEMFGKNLTTRNWNTLKKIAGKL